VSHFDNLSKEFSFVVATYEAVVSSSDPSRNGEVKKRKRGYVESDIEGFSLPASFIFLAIKYALKNAWSEKDREEIKLSVLRVYDEVVVPLDLPVIDGPVETGVEKVVRSLLIAILNAAL